MIQKVETHGRSILEIPAPEEADKKVKEEMVHSNDAADYLSSLLVAQLESQRVYFEEKLEALQESLESRMSKLRLDRQTDLEGATDRIAQLEDQLGHLTQSRTTLQSRLASLTSERDCLQQRLLQEQRLVEQLTQNQETYRLMLEERNQTIDQLNEQVSDLMGHFDSQKALAASAMLPEEVRNGKILIRTKKKGKKGK